VRINGARPLVLVELRPVRRRSWGGMVAWLVVVGLTGALVVVDAPAALLGVAALVVVLARLERPCPACRRWVQHTLACERGRA